VVYESISSIFIALRGNFFKLLQGDSSTYKSAINSIIMNRDESVSLQEVEQLVKKPVRTLLNKPNKIVHIIIIQDTRAALSWQSKLVLDYVASSNPESMNVLKCSL
jgi:hypothetical protein